MLKLFEKLDVISKAKYEVINGQKVERRPKTDYNLYLMELCQGGDLL